MSDFDIDGDFVRQFSSSENKWVDPITSTSSCRAKASFASAKPGRTRQQQVNFMLVKHPKSWPLVSLPASQRFVR